VEVKSYKLPANFFMRKQPKTIFACSILAFSFFQLAAQKIDSALNILATQFPAEKIYIHYDKEYYVAGETIWLKAYLYSDGKPSGISSNFYLQLANDKGQIISSKKYPVRGASVKGNIDLTDSLPQGVYYIRALTIGMLNNDNDFIYKKRLFIYNPSSTVVREKTSTQQNISLQFFPESGNLIDGLLTITAFKAVDQWGMPVDVSGIIKADDGTIVAPFKSFHDGIGKVQFKPQALKKYTAEIETNGSIKSFPLPEVQQSGINLKIQDEKGGKAFLLSRSSKDKEQFDPLTLVVEINNQIVYENEINFENYLSIKGHLLTDNLFSGILHFTVFNKNGLPLAERLSFLDNNNYSVPATIDIIKTGIEKRVENILELNFPDSIQRSASVSVTDASENLSADLENIYSRFLLTDDLKGHIFNPSYYFQPENLQKGELNDSIHVALDNLMLTHGWSRYSWTKILANDFPVKKYPGEYLISISGNVKDDKDKESLSGGKLNIFLEAEDSSSQTYEVPVDFEGKFRIDSLLFFGKGRVFYTYKDTHGKQRPALIHLDENSMKMVVETLSEHSEAKSLIPGEDKENIKKRYQYIEKGLEDIKELEKVVVKSSSSKKPIDIVNEKYTTGVFRSMGKVNLDNINDPANDRAMNGVDFVKNRIQQIDIESGHFVNRKNFSLMTGQKWLVDVFINEAPANISQLKTLRADQIALVKFYEAGFIGVSSSAPGGAIAVYTKKVSNEAPPDKLNFVEYNGYSITKEFYSPNYNIPEIRKEGIDNRTTLYWNPDVYTDGSTKAVKISFFNNDFSKKIRVIMEGFDVYGRLIHQEKIIGN